MKCNKVAILLDAFVDGELNGQEMLAVREHLSKCVCCEQEYQTLRLLKTEMSNLSLPQPDANFEDRLLATVYAAAEEQPRIVRRRFRVALAGVAAAAFLTLASLQVISASKVQTAKQKQSEFELQRDQAYVAGQDPLSGGSYLMPIGYGR